MFFSYGSKVNQSNYKTINPYLQLHKIQRNSVTDTTLNIWSSVFYMKGEFFNVKKTTVAFICVHFMLLYWSKWVHFIWAYDITLVQMIQFWLAHKQKYTCETFCSVYNYCLALCWMWRKIINFQFDIMWFGYSRVNGNMFWRMW